MSSQTNLRRTGQRDKQILLRDLLLLLEDVKQQVLRRLLMPMDKKSQQPFIRLQTLLSMLHMLL